MNAFIRSFLFLGALGVASGPAFRVEYVARSFPACEPAMLYAAAFPSIGRYTYRLNGTLTDGRVERVPSLGFRGTGRVTFGFVPNSSVVTLPRWTWPKMTGEERAALAAFVEAVRGHEVGHFEIAERMLGHRSSAVTVVGKTEAEASAALHAAVRSQSDALDAEIARSEALYDRVTQHGMAQDQGPLYGFPGGSNAVFRCP
ncbi:MAG: DUF922 domain-containing protein [Candidatus Eremiobacteraeota bacterium]|nr:DUF922 domain-containing protein [Candidatus Eremiobacteraeota bacterium]